MPPTLQEIEAELRRRGALPQEGQATPAEAEIRAAPTGLSALEQAAGVRPEQRDPFRVGEGTPIGNVREGLLMPVGEQDIQAGIQEVQQVTQPGQVGPTFAETAASLSIPTAASVVGTRAGAPFGPLASLGVETAFDVAGTTLNMALGLEPWSLTQLGLSIASPGVPRAALRGLSLFTRTKAMRFAIQEQAKRTAELFRANVNQAKLIVGQEGEKLDRLIRQGSKNLQDFTKFNLGHQAHLTFKRARDITPVPTEGVIQGLYRRVGEFAPEIPINAYRNVKADIAQHVKLIDDLDPELVDPAVRKLARTVQVDKPRLTLVEGVQRPTVRVEEAEAQVRRAVDLPERPATVSFQSIREAMTALGRKWAGLRDAVSRGTDPGAREKMHAVGALMDSLNQALADASQTSGVAQVARNTLKMANAAYKKRRIMDELNVMTERFTKKAGGVETFNATEMRRALHSGRDAEGMAVRQVLEKGGMFNQLDTFLKKWEDLQDKAFKELRAEELAGGERTFGRVVEDVADVRSILRQGEAGIEAAVARTVPPLSGPEIVPPDLQTVFRLAFTGASLIAAAQSALSETSTPGQSFAQAVGVASGLVFPIIFSGSLMTPSGQEWLLKLAQKSRSRVGVQVAAGMGAFFRATVPQLVPEPPQGGD